MISAGRTLGRTTLHHIRNTPAPSRWWDICGSGLPPGNVPVMTELLHLAERADWQAARDAGEYRMSTRRLTLAEQGFIHLSLPHQVRGVAERFYADADDLVLLVIDESMLDAPVRYEPPAPGVDEKFPHLYGPLPLEAVVEVRTVERDADGAFRL